MGNFYSRLSYSFGNEDWRTEQRALSIRPEDTILCVTASGDRPLNLLSTESKHIIAIDANPIQNALFDLKKSAMNELDYDHYIAFMGLEKHGSRIQTFNQLKKHLDDCTVKVWMRHLKKIDKGILYQGALEKLLCVASHCVRMLRGRKIDQLFKFDCVNEQAQFINSKWHSPFWKGIFSFCLHPWLTQLFIRDPCLYKHVDPQIHIGHYLHRRLHDSLVRFLAKENILVSLMFLGKVFKEAYPPYLEETGVEKIKQRIDRLTFRTIDLVQYLEEAPDNSFDCFSISDVASYLNGKDFTRMMHSIYRVAKPGARFCLRQVLSNHQIPDPLIENFKRNHELEQTLELEDRCFVYRFLVGEIRK